MNVLFITDNFPPEVNAIASRVYERAVYWSRWGFNVTVITCVPNFPEGKVYSGYENRWYQEETIDGIQVIRVKTFIAANRGFLMRTLDQLSFMVTGTLAASRVKGQDIVVTTSPPLFAAIGGVLVSRFLGKPFLLEISDLWPKSILALGAIKNSGVIWLLEKIELWLYRSAARVVLLTHAFERDLVARGVSGDKLDVVLNGTETTTFYPRTKDPELLAELGISDRFVIGYIGTIGMAHDLKNAIDAMDLIQDPGNQRLVMVGGGAEVSELVKYAAEKRISNVIFPGRKEKSEIGRYWSVCDVALVHLKNVRAMSEVIPSKIFEAMAMALPIRSEEHTSELQSRL